MTADRPALIRKALLLEWILIGYNILEAAVALLLGFLAGSIALVGFGFDSIVEVSCALVLVWRLRSELLNRDIGNADRNAERFVGITFLLLAAYVGWESSFKLYRGDIPDTSLPGVILAGLSLIIMPILGAMKLRIAHTIESRALRADAMETFVCAWLSLALLLGLLLHLLLDWWWADPVAALLMVPLMLKEGVAGLRGECCGDEDEECSSGQSS
jgi:divalent metal cation (Fe/Co/Zn/Cd) transporter